MTERHLWDFDHPFYCSDAMRCGEWETHTSFDTWANFKDEASALYEGDRDMNYLVRWDWHSSKLDPSWDEQDLLSLAFVLQRKGILITVDIRVTDEEEPEIRDWLKVCARTVQDTWSPLLGVVV